MSDIGIRETFFHHDGIQFFTRRAIPENPKSCIIMVHGFGDHSGRYLPMMNYFYERGHAVMFYDQRGHGRSGGRRGDVPSFQTWVSDLQVFVLESLRYIDPEIPYFVIGHSMGGLVAIHYASQYYDRIAGVVLSAPVIKSRNEMSSLKLFLLRLILRFFPVLYIDTGIKSSYLSRDEEVVHAYESDPFVFTRCTLRAGNEILKADDHTMFLANLIHYPILILQAKGDQVVSPEASCAFFDKIVGVDKKLILYEGDFHEPLNDIDKEKVFEDIHSWLQGFLR